MATVNSTIRGLSKAGNGEPSAWFDQALWKKFQQATAPESFCAHWLALQCRLIQGVSGAVVLLGSPEEDRPFSPVAFWPDKRANLKHLAEVAEQALRERRGLILKRPGRMESETSVHERCEIAYPVLAADRIYAVVALDMDLASDATARHAMEQLQWGAAWLEAFFLRGERVKDSAPQGQLRMVVDSIATIVGQERFRGAAVAFVTSLATRLECDRVSLGLLRDRRMRICALSHSAQFGKDTNLLHAIAAAMEESLDLQEEIVFPAPTEGEVQLLRAHAELARQYGNGAICSIPFRTSGQIVGVLTLERSAERPFGKDTIELCAAIMALAGPILEIQRRDGQWLLAKAIDSGRTHLRHLIGPHHVALKLTAAMVLASLLFLTFAKGDYRVTAKTVIEPMTKRAIVAAFNGYIAEAPVRAGDLVRAGEPLCRLDDRELKLERSKSLSQQEQSIKQYYDALGTRNAAQAQVLTAQIEQARSQVALIDDQLSRTRLVAPFDGVVVTGDLSQALGAPVERGQVLFEVAPLDAYRVILQVDERDIAQVKVGSRGQLALSAFPNETLPFTVEKVTPVSTTIEARNYFRVEARLQKMPERLRPGMEGISKVEIDRRRLIWIWTHEITHWLRLKLWQWLP